MLVFAVHAVAYPVTYLSKLLSDLKPSSSGLMRQTNGAQSDPNMSSIIGRYVTESPALFELNAGPT